MSTRSHIEVRDGKQKNYIYHHFDGYPSGVGVELKQTLEEKQFFVKENDFDIMTTTNMICDIDCMYELDGGLHGDEEYHYVVDCNERSLTCYKVPRRAKCYDDIVKEDNIVTIP